MVIPGGIMLIAGIFHGSSVGKHHPTHLQDAAHDQSVRLCWGQVVQAGDQHTVDRVDDSALDEIRQTYKTADQTEENKDKVSFINTWT